MNRFEQSDGENCRSRFHRAGVPVFKTVERPESSTAACGKTQMGYGACAVSGCPCKGFVDSYGSDLCGTCGHKYTDHY
jgi:hypothetical protein